MTTTEALPTDLAKAFELAKRILKISASRFEIKGDDATTVWQSAEALVGLLAPPTRRDGSATQLIVGEWIASLPKSDSGGQVQPMPDPYRKSTGEQAQIEEIVALLESPEHAPMNTHHGGTGECLVCPVALHELDPEAIARALHAAGYRKIPDEPTGVHTAACWEAFVAASNELFPGAGVSAPDDRQLDMCRRYATAVLDVLRGGA